MSCIFFSLIIFTLQLASRSQQKFLKVFSSSDLSGLWWQWKIVKNSDKREHDVMIVSGVVKNNERLALCMQRWGSQSSHASIKSVQKHEQLHLLSAGCGWNTLCSVEATDCIHMVQPLWNTGGPWNSALQEYLRCIVLWNLIPVFLFPRISLSVSHQNVHVEDLTFWG